GLPRPRARAHARAPALSAAFDRGDHRPGAAAGCAHQPGDPLRRGQPQHRQPRCRGRAARDCRHRRAAGPAGGRSDARRRCLRATGRRLPRMTPASTWFQRYLLPGFVFQAAVIAGGYATGRELVEFFLPAGPWGGLLGMAVSMLVWSVVLMLSFELARLARAYDYRSFFRVLLGRGWVVFEVGYLLLMLVILAVMGAAAGEIAHSLFGLPRLAGSLGMIAATGAMLFLGSAAIERFLVASVGYLYLVYFVFVAWCVWAFGDRIGDAFASVPVDGEWFGAGVTYAGYNVATIPAVLFCVRHFGRRREALVAGALAWPLGMLPGVAFYIAMMGWHLVIADQALPSAFLLARLQAPWFEWAFQVAVMLTLVDTGVA